MKIDGDPNEVVSLKDYEAGKRWDRLSTWQLLVQNIDFAVDLFLIYTLTLSIFPGFLAEDTGKHNLGSWYVAFSYNFPNHLKLCCVYNVYYLSLQVSLDPHSNVQCG